MILNKTPKVMVRSLHADIFHGVLKEDALAP